MEDDKLRVKKLIADFSNLTDDLISKASVPNIIKRPKGELLVKSLTILYSDIVISQHYIYDIPDFIKEKGEYAVKAWKEQKRKACNKFIEDAINQWLTTKACWDLLLYRPELEQKKSIIWEKEAEISRLLYGWRAWCSSNY